VFGSFALTGRELVLFADAILVEGKQQAHVMELALVTAFLIAALGLLDSIFGAVTARAGDQQSCAKDYRKINGRKPHRRN
jgi:hypothetical protein